MFLVDSSNKLMSLRFNQTSYRFIETTARLYHLINEDSIYESFAAKTKLPNCYESKKDQSKNLEER